MNLFQWIILPLLGAILATEVIARARRRGALIPWPIRCALWLTAGLAVAWPDWTSEVAQAVGINRGADLVLYLFVLAFLGVSMVFYSCYVRLERQMTQVVRHMAIQEARCGEPVGHAAVSSNLIQPPPKPEA